MRVNGGLTNAWSSVFRTPHHPKTRVNGSLTGAMSRVLRTLYQPKSRVNVGLTVFHSLGIARVIGQKCVLMWD